MTSGPTDNEPLTEDEIRRMAWAYPDEGIGEAPRDEDGTVENTPRGPRLMLRHPLRVASRLVSQASQRQSHHDNVEILLDRSGNSIALGNVVVHEFRTREGRISLRGEMLGPKEPFRRQLKATEEGFFLRFSNGRVSPAVLDGETLVVMGDSPFA